MRNTLFFIILNITVASVFAQVSRTYTTNNNGWYMYTGSHKIADKWGIHLEAQFRRHDVLLSNQQLLLRTGLNYHVHAQSFITIGYCFVETYPYGEFASKCSFPEHRIWEQLQVKNNVGKVEIVSRFRIEQRFVYLPVFKNEEYLPGDAVYMNRVRILNRFSVPFKGNTIENKSFYISVYDEPFISFGKNVGLNIFDQNRAYVAIGYKIPGLGKLEMGYLNQLVFKADGVKAENNHTFQLGLTADVPFRKPSQKQN